jgi:hypothetical protein
LPSLIHADLSFQHEQVNRLILEPTFTPSLAVPSVAGDECFEEGPRAGEDLKVETEKELQVGLRIVLFETTPV